MTGRERVTAILRGRPVPLEEFLAVREWMEQHGQDQ